MSLSRPAGFLSCSCSQRHVSQPVRVQKWVKDRALTSPQRCITMKEPSIYCLALLHQGVKDHYSARAFPRMRFCTNRDVADPCDISSARAYEVDVKNHLTQALR